MNPILQSAIDVVSTYLTTNLSVTRAAKIDTIAASNTIVNGSVVRNVQRGTVRMIAGDTSAVPITPVIASKCSVNVLGAGARYGANGDNVQNPYRESSPYVSSLTGTTLSIRANASSGDGGTVSWEVVEYY